MKWLLFAAVFAGCAAPQAKPTGQSVIDVPPGAKPPPTEAPPPTDQDEARRLMLEGRELVAKKAYAEAIPKFEASMKKVPNNELLYDIGHCFELMGKWGEAADTYEIYVAKNDLSHIDRRSMELRIKQLRVTE